MTSMLDVAACPALDMVCLYHERWEIEIAIDPSVSAVPAVTIAEGHSGSAGTVRAAAGALCGSQSDARDGLRI
jgi:hypothetical protein